MNKASKKPDCFGSYGAHAACREDENGIVPCPWANLCRDPYPERDCDDNMDDCIDDENGMSEYNHGFYFENE